MHLSEVGSTPNLVAIFSKMDFGRDNDNSKMQHSELSIEDIVSGIFKGDLACEDALYRKYQAGLTLMLEKRTDDRARAEDLCQDTLLIVLLNLRKGDLREVEKLTGYVYQTAKYVHLAWTRLASTKTDRNHQNTDDIVSDDNPETLQIRRQEIEAIRSLISELNMPRDRELLVRHYVEEQNKKEICDALQVSATHFDRIIYRAKSRFKAILEEKAPSLMEVKA